MKRRSTKYIEFVPVTETHNAGDRVFLRSMLDAAGIIYYIRGETVSPYLFNSLPMTVMVRIDQEQEARKILKHGRLTYSYGGRRRKADDRP
ncbi:MAG: DUF2007 domain-containing protein [Desulfobacterales bacterium]